MTSILLCISAFLATFILGNVSLVAGLGTLFGVGYFYGILRANFLQSYSHFIFDAAVLGLYLAQLPRRSRQPVRSPLQTWTLLLIAWPILLCLLPIQDYLIQLVGLRGNAFLLPFLILGSRLTEKDVYKLGFWIGVLNLAAFGFGIVEYIFGLERFFPLSPVTELMYRSRADSAYGFYRIPSTFANAHAYGGTMVMTLPLLLGTWIRKSGARLSKWFLILAMAGTILGVFMSAARIHAVILFLLLLVTNLSGKLKIASRIVFVIMILGILRGISGQERLQRFLTLEDKEMVAERIGGSVHKGFFDILAEYPLGNGLGGGGTSIPYFLSSRIDRPVLMENEYARIVLEQGIPGLLLWAVFILWVSTQRVGPRSDPWFLARRLAKIACVAYFATGLIGVGLLTSIPQSSLLLMMMGWFTTPQPRSFPDARGSPLVPGTRSMGS